MSGSTANPRVWINGFVYTAPLGTTAPSSTTDELDEAWADVGLLSQDGTTEGRDEKTTEFFARGGILVRVVRSQHKRTFKVIALEDNPTVFALREPGSTQETTSGLTTRVVKVPRPEPKAYLIEDRDGLAIARKHLARAEVTEVGERKFSEDDMTLSELTVTVYPSAEGVLYTELTTDPAAAVA